MAWFKTGDYLDEEASCFKFSNQTEFNEFLHVEFGSYVKDLAVFFCLLLH